MGDTSETNTKVLSRELFLGVVALKRLYRKIIICVIRSLSPNPVTYNTFALIKKIVYVLMSLFVDNRLHAYLKPPFRISKSATEIDYGWLEQPHSDPKRNQQKKPYS